MFLVLQYSLHIVFELSLIDTVLVQSNNVLLVPVNFFNDYIMASE